MDTPNDRIMTLILIVFISIIFSVTTYLMTTSKYTNISIFNKMFRNKNYPSSDIPGVKNNKCKQNGYDDPENYLRKYTVKFGDTFESIANAELGDSSRVQELITLNKNIHPNISLDNSVINEGWELLLPPDASIITSQNTSGHLKIVNGIIGNILNRGTTYEIYGMEPPSDHIATFTKDEFTLISKNVNLNIGDCVTAIIDLQKPKVYSIQLQ